MQPSFRADCHCHTHHSDGALSVEDLLTMAQSVGLQGLAITDHDTIDAYPTALPLAKQLGISLVSGIELSAQFEKSSIHVLGYAFDLQHPELTKLCESQQAQRDARNIAILDKLKALGCVITADELSAAFPYRSIGRPHIAQLMVQKGFVPSIKIAFERYLAERKRCYVGGFDLSVTEAIHAIQAAGGFAVLAHPYVIQPQRHVKALLALPFDGIEVHYGMRQPGEEQAYLNEAMQRNLMVTGGSDFHGGTKSYLKLGSRFTPPDTFKQFETRFAQYASL